MNRLQDQLAKGQNKCLLAFNGGLVNGASSTNYQAQFYLNGVQIVDGGKPNVPGAAMPNPSVNWEAHQVAAAPTTPVGWPDASPLGITWISSKNADALA